MDDMKRTLFILLATTVAWGCSGDVADDSTSWNSADETFVQNMIPHHEQAIAMADLVAERSTDQRLLTLAESIRSAQVPEVAALRELLAEWGVASDAHSGHGDDAHAEHGMMTEAELEALADTTGAAFDAMWLRMMIAHHDGAIAMANEVLDAGSDPAVRTIAEAVIAGQRAEVAFMNGLVSGG